MCIFIKNTDSVMTQQDLKMLLGCIPCTLLAGETTEPLKNPECFRGSSTVMPVLGALSKTEHYKVPLFISVSNICSTLQYFNLLEGFSKISCHDIHII